LQLLMPPSNYFLSVTMLFIKLYNLYSAIFISIFLYLYSLFSKLFSNAFLYFFFFSGFWWDWCFSFNSLKIFKIASLKSF
jgi:hypothetical protein